LGAPVLWRALKVEPLDRMQRASRVGDVTLWLITYVPALTTWIPRLAMGRP
jgi:hypothetical protein